jgi:hypothetical protein
MSEIEQFDSRRKATLRATAKNYVPAIACAFIPLLCYFVVRPFAEIGISDDWSYIKTTQVLAQTGHILYNGWATAMLGWQLYFGELFIKVLGFSFTVVRFSTVIEAMATAFLLQRTFVRAGINSWNATLATMTFILSPLCLPLEFTFMSDISGVLSIVVCLYMCLRALQAENERSAMLWIGVAALLNAISGTARQIAWLGVLVMVPSTLWLLRRNRRVLVVGCLACIIGASIVIVSMHWFARQAYSIPQPLIPSRIDLSSMKRAVAFGLRSSGQLALLALPVLLMFAGTLRSWNRRMAAILLAGFCCFVVPGIALALARLMHVQFVFFVADDFQIVLAFKRLNAIAVQATHLSIASDGLQMLLTGAVALGLLSLVTCSFAARLYRHEPQQSATEISWQKLGFLLGPFSLAYIGFLAPGAMRGEFDDRYLVPLFAILLLVLARYYQQRVRANLPTACVLLIAIFGVFSVTAAHDMFAMYRGYVSAISQLLSTGASATSISGPLEFEGWTEIEKIGYVNDPRIRFPKGAWVPPPARSLPADCNDDFLDWTPAIKPVYAIVGDPTACGSQLALPPVTYTTWIAPHINSIYTVRLPATAPD